MIFLSLFSYLLLLSFMCDKQEIVRNEVKEFLRFHPTCLIMYHRLIR